MRLRRFFVKKRRLGKLLLAGTAMLLGCIAPLSAAAQADDSEELAAGALLVADRELADPNFAQTVVLLVQYDDDGAMGLIINRKSDVPLAKLLEDLKEAAGRSDPAFAGGPVERSGILALLRTKKKPEDDTPNVFADVYLVANKERLAQTLASKAGPDVFRVYVGYAGWGPGQLEKEMDLGAWHVFPGDAKVVFDGDPDSLWSKLIRRTELRIAMNRRTGRRDGSVAPGAAWTARVAGT
jgi:putative transcriptional regulator